MPTNFIINDQTALLEVIHDWEYMLLTIDDCSINILLVIYAAYISYTGIMSIMLADAYYTCYKLFWHNQPGPIQVRSL